METHNPLLRLVVDQVEMPDVANRDEGWNAWQELTVSTNRSRLHEYSGSDHRCLCLGLLEVATFCFHLDHTNCGVVFRASVGCRREGLFNLSIRAKVPVAGCAKGGREVWVCLDQDV